MLNRMFCQVIMDLLGVFIIASGLSQKMDQVYACSERLFYCGVILVSYYIFYTLRKIIICVSCYFSSKPMKGSNIALGVSCFFDMIVNTGLLIWICTVLAEEKTYTCT